MNENDAESGAIKVNDKRGALKPKGRARQTKVIALVKRGERMGGKAREISGQLGERGRVVILVCLKLLMQAKG